MQWTNTERGYGWLSIALHWLALIAIVAMFWSGFAAENAGELGDRAARRALMGFHTAFGASVALILFARVALHFLQRQPTPAPQSPALSFLSTATHKLLLLAILIQFISGPIAIWSGGRDINVFDLFAIPTPFAERNEAIHEGAEVAHAIGRWMLLSLIVLHVLGALKHAFIDRDGVLRRMLAPAKD